ncbi:ATP-binding protein [Ancylomarina sp. 16SWW S1-10-2]|uniref:ATP-binding protein n=1 Tax=Ancylomarina sp. 16SWW S1-10-2 TaxID=2499681 RepID=UPI001E19019B|nr:ATPase [Ancylomarina sp. 16SWW S1-10-2]
MKIAIASGKGGTGKTTLSSNLAAYISEKEKVVLCDLDVEEPNSGLFIKGKLIHKEDKFKMVPSWDSNKCTFCGLCQDVCNYNAVIKLEDKIMVFPDLCHSCYACSELCPENALPMIPEKMGELKHFESGDISFIESHLDVGREQAVPLISQTIEYVDEHFPKETIRLYDSPPGTSCPVIEATKEVDFVILITEPTPFGFHDLKLAIETMKKMEKEFAVVINRYGIGNDDVLNYCKDNDIPLLAKIPNDRYIAELYSSGELIYTRVPEVKKQLKHVYDYILKLKENNEV